jgi:hypothetical protein
LRHHSTPWVRALAGSLALLVAFAFSAPPAYGAEVAAPKPVPAKPGTLAAATAAKLATLDTSEAVSLATTQTPAAGQPDDPGTFFKSSRGLAVLALMVAGMAGVVYYRGQDRIKSPVRE